jgi:hypothetical protein
MTIIKNFNDSLAELEYFTRLWKACVPAVIDTPQDPVFMIWIATVPRQGLQHAITKTGRKMVANIAQNITIEKFAAEKYCSSLVGYWRSSQQPEVRESLKAGKP